MDITVVVPVYKEEGNIRPFLDRMEPVLAAISERYEILFCLDPSPDRKEAGIALSRGAAGVVIDVDLQDPPELIADLYARMRDGFDVVSARRRSRKGETVVKRIASWIGYDMINRLADVEIPRNTGDLRIMSRRVCDELTRLNEGHGFLRGLVAYVGFPQAYVEYDRDPRHAGAGHYNRFLGSLKIGVNGVVSFGSRPLQLMSVAEFRVAGFSFFVGAYYVIGKIAGVESTAGLPPTVLAMSFFAGVQLLSLGLIGEYVGRIDDEVKWRPK